MLSRSEPYPYPRVAESLSESTLAKRSHGDGQTPVAIGGISVITFPDSLMETRKRMRNRFWHFAAQPNFTYRHWHLAGGHREISGLPTGLGHGFALEASVIA